MTVVGAVCMPGTIFIFDQQVFPVIALPEFFTKTKYESDNRISSQRICYSFEGVHDTDLANSNITFDKQDMYIRELYNTVFPLISAVALIKF